MSIAVALPAWWLGHLALLGRPVRIPPCRQWRGAGRTSMEWYPPGRLLLWIAGFGFVPRCRLIPLVCGKGADAAEALRSALLQALARSRAVDRTWSACPAAGRDRAGLLAMVIMKMLTLNLWLAGKIAATSGRLNRSWPDVRARHCRR